MFNPDLPETGSSASTGMPKIAIQAPPVDDAANRMCIEFLSKCLNLPRSAVEILRVVIQQNKTDTAETRTGSAFPEQAEMLQNANLYD